MDKNIALIPNFVAKTFEQTVIQGLASDKFTALTAINKTLFNWGVYA